MQGNKNRTHRKKPKKVRNENKKYFDKIMGVPVVLAPEYVNYVKTKFNDEQAQFLKDLEYALQHYKKIYLSFVNTASIKITALLVIYSIIDLYGKDTKIIIVWSRKDRDVNLNIKASGSFQDSEIREKFLIQGDSLPVIKGSNASVVLLQKKIIDFIVSNRLDSDSSDFIDRKTEIGIAIQETLDNVGRHAYPDMDHCARIWWFCCDVIEDRLYIAIYDAGIGIPNSIRNSQIDYLKLIEQRGEDNESIITSLKNIDEKDIFSILKESIADKELIRVGMSNNLSTIKKDRHGKGSSSIKALIKEDKNSFLFILSGNGIYLYSKYNESVGKKLEAINDIENYLQGTLIQWSL